jgi:hypothetical protein
MLPESALQAVHWDMQTAGERLLHTPSSRLLLVLLLLLPPLQRQCATSLLLLVST